MPDQGWRGMLAPLDVPTGDGRRFLASGMTSRPLPLALKWQREDNMGHDNSVIVGSLETINYGTVAEAIDAGWIDAKCVDRGKYADTLMATWGMGLLFAGCNPKETPRLAEDVAESILLLGKKVIGPSVDTGSCEVVLARKGSDEPLSNDELEELMWDDGEEETEIELLFTAYEIAAATLVPIPAFAECRPFELINVDQVLTAAVRSDGWNSFPLADRELEWDEAAADKRVSDDAGIGGETSDWQRYASGHLYVDENADPETKGAYKFLIVDIIDGTMTIVPRGVFTTAAVLQGSMGGTKIPQADQDAMKTVVGRLYERMAKEFDDPGIVAPWDAESSSASLRAVTASAPAPIDPTWLEDPKLGKVTPLTVTEDGRVFGHVATHNVCHIGIPGVCTTAPINDDGYGMFHRYEIDGADQPVGRITVGHGKHRCDCGQCGGRNDDHACLRLSLGGAIAHHDQLATVAWVRAGEDETNNAIWVSGMVAPTASLEDLQVLTRQKVSGDWRPLRGTPELIEVLALSRENPGFPLPRVRVSSGQLSALTAAGYVRPEVASSGETADVLDYEKLADMVASRVAGQLAKQSAPVPPVEISIRTSDGTTPTSEQLQELIAEVAASLDEATITQIQYGMGW